MSFLETSDTTSALITSLIAFAGTILVAIFTYVTTKSIKRKEFENQKNIELLRIEATKNSEKRLEEKAKKEKKTQKANDDLDKKMDALVTAIKSTQQIKNEIDVILSSCREGITVSEAINDMSSVSKKAMRRYTDQAEFLCEESRNLFHKTKKISASLAKIIENHTQNKQYTYDIQEKGKQLLLQNRSQLSDIQEILRDNKTEIVFIRMKNND